jgi:hypothetical protein
MKRIGAIFAFALAISTIPAQAAHPVASGHINSVSPPHDHSPKIHFRGVQPHK